VSPRGPSRAPSDDPVELSKAGARGRGLWLLLPPPALPGLAAVFLLATLPVIVDGNREDQEPEGAEAGGLDGGAVESGRE